MKVLKVESKIYGQKEILIDDEDWTLVSNHNWCVRKIHKTFYAFTTTRKPFSMHRLILGAKKGEIVDHIDRNGLNNQRTNIRICNTSKNAVNALYPKRTTTNYRGVWKNEKKNRWHSRIRTSEGRLYLGSFLTAEEAAIAYNKAALKYHGDFAILNEVNYVP